MRPVLLLLRSSLLAMLVSCSTTVEEIGSGGSTTSTTTTTLSGGAGGSGGGVTTSPGGGGSGGVPDPWEPLQGLKEVDLGTVDFSASPSHVILPDRMLGFTLLAEAAPDKVVGVYQLKPPAGSSVIFNYAMAGHSTQVFGDLGWVSAADPQSMSTDAWPVQAGNWTYAIGSDTPSGQAHVRVYARRTLDGQFHGGVIDVNVFLANGTVSQNYVQSMLQNHLFPVYFTPVGLGLGNVAFYSAPPGSTVIDSQTELRALFASSASVASAPALNLFVVGDFSDGAFGFAIGVAGGIPGSPMRNGTTRSGVAFVGTNDQAYDASVLGHEVSHIAGLFHTTEVEVAEVDPLNDTPSCAANVIQNNPQACPDVSNVMFPIAYGGTTFSSGQVTVFRGSALYRGTLSAGGQPEGPLLSVASGSGPGPAPFVADPDAVVLSGDTPARVPSDALEAVLSAGFCAHSAAATSALVLRAVRTHGVDRLIALARDPGAADRVRARALAVVARLGADPSGASGLPGGELAAPRGVAALAGELFAAPNAGRMLRLAALAALARVDAPAARTLARATATADAVIEARLARLR